MPLSFELCKPYNTILSSLSTADGLASIIGIQYVESARALDSRQQHQTLESYMYSPASTAVQFSHLLLASSACAPQS
jgi:hypothetical protein